MDTTEDLEAQRARWQAKADETGQEVWWRGECFTPFAPKPPPIVRKRPRSYKVITQRDEYFGGKFDPQKLETLMNTLAEDGWRVVSVATADVSTFWGTFWAGRGARQEIIVFLEKDEREAL